MGPVASAPAFTPYGLASVDNPYALYGDVAVHPSSYTVRHAPTPSGAFRTVPADSTDDFLLGEDGGDDEGDTAARATVVLNRRRRKHSPSFASATPNDYPNQTSDKNLNEPGADGADSEFHTD